MVSMRTKIGKGLFTTAYLLEDGTVELISCDHIKECMGHGWFPDGRLLPDIEYISNYDSDGFYNVYHMEYYEKPLSLKKNLCVHDWRLYQLLRKLDIQPSLNPHDTFNLWHEQFDTLPDEFEEEREEIKESLDACGNYGSDINFEISPRNVGVKDGKLILLDCFFVASQAREVRKEKHE